MGSRAVPDRRRLGETKQAGVRLLLSALDGRRDVTTCLNPYLDFPSFPSMMGCNLEL